MPADVSGPFYDLNTFLTYGYFKFQLSVSATDPLATMHNPQHPNQRFV